MPLYIADYLKDTTHLGALESGAYLHLIMDYWQNEKLPSDDKMLARIARLTEREWKAAKATLQDFFHDGWEHTRIDAEIKHAAEVSGKRREAVAKREQNKHLSAIKHPSIDGSNDLSNASSNDDTLHTSHSSSLDKSKEASDEVQLFVRGKKILGQNAGGLIKNLLAAKDGSVPLARAAVEQASTKQDPREYLGAIIRGREEPECRPDRSF